MAALRADMGQVHRQGMVAGGWAQEDDRDAQAVVEVGGRTVMEQQKIALRIMQGFVRQHGGDVAEIRVEDGTYRWTAPDGRVAALGWVG